MLRGTPVISAGFQAKISKFCLSKEHSSLRPFSVMLIPMANCYLAQRPNGLSVESDKVGRGWNHLIPYFFTELYEAMLIQDFRGCFQLYYTYDKVSPFPTSMIIGLSIPSSSLRGRKDSAVPVEVALK
ncbi:hypothetical protein Tco_0946947 [Tanacetum coccineum]